MQKLREFVNGNTNFVVAHRGSSGTSPENTFASFGKAIETGAMMIETDIQVTGDGHIIVFHDKDFRRIARTSKNVKDLTLKEIKEIDIGSWFSPDYKNERVPLLSELLEFISDKCYLNIEIKKIHPEQIETTVKELMSLIFNYNYSDNVLLSSFYYETLELVKKLYPEIPVAPIKIPPDNRLPSDLLSGFQFEAFVCEINEINEILINDLEKNGLYLGVYSVDTVEQLNKILKYPVKAIVSNYPGRIIEALASHQF